MSTTYTLESLSARAEIEDVIHRYCHATDRRRWWLMDSVFHEDATCRLSSIGGSWREFVAQGSALLEPVDATHHQVGNIMIAFEGTVAHVETYVTAFHAVPHDAPAGGSFGGTGEAYEVMLGARYIDRFELRDGRWRIADRRLLTEWRNHRPSREGGLAAVTAQARGQREDGISGSVVEAWRTNDLGRADSSRLVDRAEIADVVNRFCHAVDRNRWELMASVFHEDGKTVFIGNELPWQKMVENARVSMGSLERTHHQTGNMLFSFDGDVAEVETYVTAYHRVPSTAPAHAFWDGRNEDYEGVAGGRYIDRFERRDGRWLMVEHRTFVEWRHDHDVAEGSLAQTPSSMRGQRGDADASLSVVAALLN
ncbi:hypothetical protein B2J88_19695 [Rhodococcus sp. SRB_17]|nr:hypothetical protein [Rhodococcus sp. SRB_17]